MACARQSEAAQTALGEGDMQSPCPYSSERISASHCSQGSALELGRGRGLPAVDEAVVEAVEAVVETVEEAVEAVEEAVEEEVGREAAGRLGRPGRPEREGREGREEEREENGKTRMASDGCTTGLEKRRDEDRNKTCETRKNGGKATNIGSMCEETSSQTIREKEKEEEGGRGEGERKGEKEEKREKERGLCVTGRDQSRPGHRRTETRRRVRADRQWREGTNISAEVQAHSPDS